jgi:Plant transposase (Ptta/En/Spm family)
MDDFGLDIDKWKEVVPYWCKNPQNWHGLCDIWSTEGWQKLSTQNKHNRCGAGRIVTHYAGSRSAYKHHKEMVNTVKKNSQQQISLLSPFVHLCRVRN